MTEIPPPPLASPGIESGSPKAADGELCAIGETLPARFGKYTLLRKLATGGMAELYLAMQRSMAGFEKLVVIKRILPPLGHDQQFVDMLLHEARVAATLSHPNIVAVFDVGEVDGTHYIAMEHVHGEDLRSMVRQMRATGVATFPFEHAIAIVLGICAGLAEAHEKRDLDGRPLHIVHRDISPQNTVVTFGGDVKIVDFGIAKSDVQLHENTQSGKLKGKVPYMSPEQARGEPLDARSDIFSAGIILFELTTGKRLFKGASDFETLKLICDRDVPPPSVVCEEYPTELERIVMKALSNKRDDRYASAREMRADLEEFVRTERVRVSSIALSEFMRQLFAEKLESPELTLVAARRIADDIASEKPAPLVREAESQGQIAVMPTTKSMPAAARTMHAPAHTGGGMGTVAALAALALAGSGASLWWAHEQATASTANDAAMVRHATLRVQTDPPGATIWIDGDPRAEVTPAVITSVPAGRPLEVKVTKDGFEQYRQVVTIAADGTGVVDASLKAGALALEVFVAPSPGLLPTLTLDDKPVAQTTAGKWLIADLTPRGSHRLRVSAPGFVEQTMSFEGAPFETKHFDIALVHAGSEGSTRVGSEKAPATSPRSFAPLTGRLNVGTSSGWCDVTVDGTPRGATPIAGLELAVGAHHVTCTSPDGHAQSATILVLQDATTRHKFSIAP